MHSHGLRAIRCTSSGSGWASSTPARGFGSRRRRPRRRRARRHRAGPVRRAAGDVRVHRPREGAGLRPGGRPQLEPPRRGRLLREHGPGGRPDRLRDHQRQRDAPAAGHRRRSSATTRWPGPSRPTRSRRSASTSRPASSPAARSTSPRPRATRYRSAGASTPRAPTTDPAAAAAGGLAIPLGAPEAPYKGFGLALALEALAGVLAGAKFGRQHAVEVEPGEMPWDEGHFFLAFDPGLVYAGRRVQAAHGRADPRRPPGLAGPRATPRCQAAWAARSERALREGLRLPALDLPPAARDAPRGPARATRLPPAYCAVIRPCSSSSPKTSSGPLRSVGRIVLAIAAARRIFSRICSSDARSRSG